MTAKEKAKELVEKMFSNMPKYLQGKIGSETAKQCALICVDEILQFHDRIDVYYCNKVKQEINKL